MVTKGFWDTLAHRVERVLVRVPSWDCHSYYGIPVYSDTQGRVCAGPGTILELSELLWDPGIRVDSSRHHWTCMQFYTEFQHVLWSKTRSLNLFGHWTAVLDPTSKGLHGSGSYTVLKPPITIHTKAKIWWSLWLIRSFCRCARHCRHVETLRTSSQHLH